MIEVQNNGFVSARQLHSKLEIKTKFTMWIERAIQVCGLEEGKEFFPFLGKTLSSQGGGRPTQEYDLTIDAAKEVCIIGESKHAGAMRKYLIGLSNQVDTSDLLTHDQVLYLVKLKEVFKYINNCKEATKLHTEKFVSMSDAKNPYAEFHLFRNDILKLGKEEIDERLRLYCAEHFINPKAKTTTEKLAIIDKFEVLRNGVWDFLMASGSQQSLKLANLAMNMAKLDHTPIYRNNETNLFQQKQSELNVKQLAQIQELTRE